MRTPTVGRDRVDAGGAALRAVVMSAFTLGLIALALPATGEPPQRGGRVLWERTLGGMLGAWSPAVAKGRVFVSGGLSSYAVYALAVSDGRVLWEARTHDNGPMTPTVDDDHVTVTTESCTVYTLNAETGREVWTKWLGDPIWSSPAVAKGHVYVAGNENKGGYRLYKLNAKTGAVAWQAPVGQDVRGAPVVTDDAVYVTTMDGRLKALAPGTGNKLWEHKETVASLPAVHRGRLFVTLGGGNATRLAGMDGRRGAVAWTGPSGPTATQRGGTVATSGGAPEAEPPPYFGSGDPDAATEADGAAAEGGTDGDGAAAGAVAGGGGAAMTVNGATWGAGIPGAPMALVLTPTAADGKVYAVRDDGGFTCTDAATGAPLWAIGSMAASDVRPWTPRLPPPKDGTAGSAASASGGGGGSGSGSAAPLPQRRFGPAAVVHGRVYVGTNSGVLSCYDAATGRPVWSVGLGGGIHATPAVVGGKVYVTCDNGKVYCVDAGDPQADGWAMWGGGPAHAGSGG
ncbi:MAG: PQQ-binding-like beta-propeller repeat protein [Planctomycetes bacterium]|nr:PQQ-binding-like beta-propeller repeat protein [Planctomycetota bacterium]